MAASAGGVFALRHVLDRLTPSFAAPIAVVQHLSPSYPSIMAEVLGFKARMPVRFAQEGDRLHAGIVHVAPRNVHLTVSADRRFRLADGEKLNSVRPAADILFESSSRVLGPRVLGVVLSGLGHDGARGACAIRDVGGVVMVQDPNTASSGSMPQSVIDAGAADLILDLDGIARALVSLVMVPGACAYLGLPRLAA